MVDDHDVVRSGLTALLTAELGIDVVGQAADGPAAFAEAERLGPDVVLLDIDLPGADGITVAAGLVERLPACRVLMLTALDRPGHLRRALAAGAAGYLLKSTTPARTADAIRRIAAGGRVIDPRMHGEERAYPARSPTRRPRPSGWPPHGAHSREIAADLFLSVGTVRNRLSSAVGKLHARTLVDAVRIAKDQGWV